MVLLSAVASLIWVASLLGPWLSRLLLWSLPLGLAGWPAWSARLRGDLWVGWCWSGLYDDFGFGFWRGFILICVFLYLFLGYSLLFFYLIFLNYFNHFFFLLFNYLFYLLYFLLNCLLCGLNTLFDSLCGGFFFFLNLFYLYFLWLDHNNFFFSLLFLDFFYFFYFFLYFIWSSFCFFCIFSHFFSLLLLCCSILLFFGSEPLHFLLSLLINSIGIDNSNFVPAQTT